MRATVAGLTHNARMLKILTSGLVDAVVVVGTTAPAEASPLVDKGDRHGDVQIVGDTEGVDPAVVASVDLRHVTVTRLRDGVRVVIRLKEVLPAGRWVQEVGLSVEGPGWVGPTWMFFVNAFPQHPQSAGAFFLDVTTEGDDGPEDEGDGKFCRVAVKTGDRVVRLDVPERCLPDEAGELSVSSALLDKRAKEDPLIAQDDLAFGQPVDLQPDS